MVALRHQLFLSSFQVSTGEKLSYKVVYVTPSYTFVSYRLLAVVLVGPRGNVNVVIIFQRNTPLLSS